MNRYCTFLSIVLLFAFLNHESRAEETKEQHVKNKKTIELTFAKHFISAISTKSVEACADLVINSEDNKLLEIDYGLSEKAYRKRLRTQSENFLKENREFIHLRNANNSSAISQENFLEIDTYDFEIPKSTLLVS